jgi:hypothetical protein
MKLSAIEPANLRHAGKCPNYLCYVIINCKIEKELFCLLRTQIFVSVFGGTEIRLCVPVNVYRTYPNI